MPRVVITMPAYGNIAPETTFSLLGLFDHSRQVIAGIPGHVNFIYVDQARNMLVQEVLRDTGATHMLGLDSDMTWPADALERLLAHDLPVVGGMYFRRMPPFNTVPSMFVPGTRLTTPLPQLPRGLHKVDVLGMGCTLIRTDVFRQMAERFGDAWWFKAEGTGEDVHFFHRLQTMGIPAYVDGDLICKHKTELLVDDFHWKKAHGVS